MFQQRRYNYRLKIETADEDRHHLTFHSTFQRERSWKIITTLVDNTYFFYILERYNRSNEVIDNRHPLFCSTR